ncbi:MAG: T9SS type A sorting domain-containing protein [Lentimicrobiaceae bacterium]|nr:T9SS type A sorting domain-containing protein [Lentimicrobiaceae bacterium]
MKKIILILCLLASGFWLYFANAQPWLDLLPQNKASEELTLKDYQQAFNTYWEPFNVQRGMIEIDGKKSKAGGWKQFKRWEYYMEGIVDPETGVFPDKTGIQVVREHRKTHPEVYANTPRASNWSSLGPFESGGGYAGIGRINCMAFHPVDNNIWWVGAASGGLWVTNNNGASWECLTDNNGVLAVSDIIIPTDFVTSQTIYIATGDRSAGDNSSIGVLKSTDNGATWQETGLTFAINQGRRTNRLLLDPNDNNTIIAATTVGVYKTTDGGATWPQLSSREFRDMRFKPGDYNTLYGASGAGIWLSTDGGSTWNQTLSVGQQRTELAVTPANPNIVYAVISAHSSGLHGVYKSTNSGESFQQMVGYKPNMLGWEFDGSDTLRGQGWYDLCIAASPTNADIVLVGGINTWRSTNGGTNWQCVTHWWGQGGITAVHADKHALAFRNDGILFEGNDGGIYISPNNGTTWTDKTNGMQISQLYKLGCSATDPKEIMTGLQDNGSKLFTQDDWRDVMGGDGMECIIDYSNVNIQYGTIYFGVIERTTNHWNSKTKVSPRDDGAWVTPYVIHPEDPQILYAGYADLYKTMNRGNTWAQISNVNTNNKLRNIAICESDPDVIYMADETRLWRTSNGGDSWTSLIIPVTSGSVTSICVKNNDPNTIWITRGGYNAFRVYQSTNGGSSWTNISAGLPSIPMYSIVYNKLGGENDHLYVGSEVGIYFKHGDGHWVAFNNGLPNVKIGEIEIYYDLQDIEGCRLRAATYGRGLWESPIYTPTTPIPGTITGNTQLCDHDVAQLFLIGFAGTVQWQKSEDAERWEDITGANTAAYQSEPLTASKYFRVKVTIGDATVYADEVFVKVNPIPGTPIITKIENSLQSNAEEGNQWYNQDGLIPGAIGQTFTPTETGTYFTIVTITGCSSEPSNSIEIDLSIGGNAVKDGHFTLFPNPFNEHLTIHNEELRIKRIVLIDVLGKEVINVQISDVTETQLNVAKIPAGLYQVRIETDKGVYTSKVVKQ